LEVNTNVDEDEEEHINIDGKNNSNSITVNATINPSIIDLNSYDIFDSDSDDDIDLPLNVQSENASEYSLGLICDDMSRERISSERMTVLGSSSSSSSSSTPLTLNRRSNNFTDPYINNLENFDEHDVNAAVNNCGFFAIKRSKEDNFATIVRVSNNNNDNNFEIGGTINAIKSLDNKYVKLSNMREAYFTQLMKSGKRIDSNLLGYKNPAESVDVVRLEDRRLSRNYLNTHRVVPQKSIVTAIKATATGKTTKKATTNITAGITQPGVTANRNNRNITVVADDTRQSIAVRLVSKKLNKY